jgi:hypothetical protein
MIIYNDEYWAMYDTVKEVLASRGIFDENIIHSKTKDIINKKNASHEAPPSTSSRQTDGG